MKKFYLLFALLLSFAGVTQMMAQDDEVTVAINANTGDYTLWNGNASNPWARGWQSASTDPQIAINCGANNFAPWNGTDFRFFNCVGGNGTSYEYTFSVSAGWEFVSVSLDFTGSAANEDIWVSVEGEQSETNNSTTEFIHYEYENFSPETTEFGFTVGANSSSKFAHTKNFVVTVRKMEGLSVALLELEAVYEKYYDYGEEGSHPFVVGTEPGNYDADAVDAFNAALLAVNVVEAASDLTVEMVEAAQQAIIDTYEAVLLTKAPLTLADGYYRFRTAINYNDGNDKYMYVVNADGTISGKWGTIEDIETSCPALWQVTNTADGAYDIVSVATDARFNDNPGTLSLESTHTMVLEPVVTLEGVTYVNIKYEGMDPGTYNRIYVHQAGHGSGAGTGGNLTVWNPTYPTTLENQMGASEWCIEAVDAADAAAIIEAYAPIKEREELVANFNSLLAEANQAVKDAKDIQEYTNLITENSQFSSPWTEPSEGSLDNLLDGNASTFWHSAWSAGNVPNHTHYLAVELAEPVSELVQLKITRRPVSNDHVTLWGVWGANDADAADEVLWTEEDELPEGVNVGDVKVASEWVEVASLSTPYGNNTETVTSKEFDTQGFKYLRFYIDGTTTGRGYGHVSEFQLVIPVVNEHSQFAYMGEVATNLDALLRDLNEFEEDDITTEAYEALVEAYDAFKAQFVDPTELRELLASVEGIANGVVVGTQPGYWKDASTGDALKATYAEAKAYDEGGIYAANKSNEFIELLNAQTEAVKAAVIGIEEGKWYRIHFGSKEVFEENGWDIENNEATIVADEYVTNEALWDKYITAAKHASEEVTYTEETENEEGEVTEEERTAVVNLVVPFDTDEDIVRGVALYFDADEDIQNKDLSLFRFISVGDSAYVLQNKATGLFLRAENTTLDVIPSLFNVSAAGYGQNVIAARNLITGGKQNNLNFQRALNRVVTYNESAAGSRSALYIEEAGDVENYDGTTFNMSLKPGSVNAFCFPVGISSEDATLYDVAKVEENKITLCEIEEAVAGRPFIFINEGNYDEEAEDAEAVQFKHDYEFTTEAIQASLLKGTYRTLSELDKGVIVTRGDGFVVNKSNISALGGISVPAYSAYIAGEEPFELRDDYIYEIDGDLVDGIAATLQKVATNGTLYTIDGRFLSKSANLNDLKKYGKGIYILNGTKVVVK